MTCLSDLIHEMQQHGVPRERANQIAAELVAIGAEAAPYRTDIRPEIDRVDRVRALQTGQIVGSFQSIGQAALRVVDGLQPDKKAAE